MTKIESTQALQPYLNPDYWGGHSIGYGQPSEDWPDPSISGRESRQSAQVLQARLALMEKVFPIETFTDGQTFGAEAYELGTLVIFRTESLHGKPEDIPVDIESLVGQSLPTRPYDVSPSFGHSSTTETIEGSNITYYTAARWGIVAANKSHKKLLHTVSTAVAYKLGGGKALVTASSLLTRDSPIEVGRTRHYVGHESGSERLDRINILNVVAYGETQRQKRSLGSLAARLAFGGNST